MALTDPTNKWKAYASYDVKDQYGKSMRASTSITWAGSAKITGDKATGKLTIEKTNHTDDWVYGEQIYVTGVNAKTGSSVNKTLTVGTQQSLDSLEIAGFVKKGTSTIIQTLPADFKKQTYYLLFRAKDQQGTVLDPDKVTNADVTFVSDNVLVVKEIGALQPDLTIEGETYKAAFVEPGIKVADGGKVTVTAIANKTGNKTEITVDVTDDRVVASFTISAPTSIVADGDKNVEIPFTALDQNLDPITDFVTLAKQETFNKLTFNASEGTLKLAEQNDGSAKLLWTDKQDLYGETRGWDRTDTTDGIDRPVSLTAIVVGGGTANEMMNVSDKRRPNAIIAAKVDEVYTEGTDITFRAAGYNEATKDWDETNKFESFQFQDQYQKTIKGTDTDEKYGDSTGFFAAANGATLASSDTEISGHKFGVRVKYAGSGYIKMTAKTGATTELTGDAIADANGPAKQAVLINTNDVVFTTSDAVESAATGEGFKFEIAKVETVTAGKAAEWDTITPAKYQAAAVVDLSQIKSFAISDLNKFYVGASATFTGEGQIAATKLGDTAGSLGNDNKTAFGAATGGLSQVPVDPANPTAAETQAAEYQQKVEVKGTYNGISVTIPAKFYKVVGSKVTTAETLGANKVNATVDTATGLTIQDLYDRTSAKGVAKEATDTLKVTLYNIYGGATNGTNTTAISYYDMKATTAAASAALIDADTAAGAAKAVTLVTIPAGTMTQAQVIAAIETANGHLDAVVAADAGNHATAAAEITAMKTSTATITTDGFVVVYDTASKDITISDQKPVATKISGLKDSYTLSPDNTRITNAVIVTKVVTEPKVKVLDQYGVAMTPNLSYRATDIVENANAYAANNFSTSGNDSGTLAIPSGAERGDTFTLVLTQDNATASTAITVGADEKANITGAVNNYETLVKNYLEPQRLAGLG